MKNSKHMKRIAIILATLLALSLLGIIGSACGNEKPPEDKPETYNPPKVMYVMAGTNCISFQTAELNGTSQYEGRDGDKIFVVEKLLNSSNVVVFKLQNGWFVAEASISPDPQNPQKPY